MKKKIFLAALLALSVLCGCTDTTKDKEGTKGTPVEGGKLTIGIAQDLDSLDPHVAQAAGTDEVLFNIFEGLVKVDEFGDLNPAVAASYEISADAKTYTFVLRDNVKFHNGDTVEAEDVVYSLKRCAGFEDCYDANVLLEPALSVISDVQIKDKKTVVLTLSEPSTELIWYLTCAIVPADYKDQASAPIGTGPYRFVSYEPLSRFVVEKFNDYYGTPGHLDTVTFKIFPNLDSAFLELMAGSVDLMSQLTIDRADQLTKDFNIETSRFNLVQALFLNNAVKPFDNINVRKALCYAIDRDEINQIISDGRGTVIGSAVFPGMSSFFAGELVDVYPYDTEKAKSLLKTAGYPDGFTFTIKIPSSYDAHMATGEIIVEQLKKVGITAKIEPVEWSTWLSDVYSRREFQATIIGFDANLAPNDILKRYNSTSSKNMINYINPAFDEAFNNGLASVSNEDKIRYYKECQRILTEDAASVYIEDPAQLTAVKKNLKGYTPYPIYVMDISKLYWTE